VSCILPATFQSLSIFQSQQELSFAFEKFPRFDRVFTVDRLIFEWKFTETTQKSNRLSPKKLQTTVRLISSVNEMIGEIISFDVLA
jgi:hypothetical protein